MLNIAICDDEDAALAIIENLVRKSLAARNRTANITVFYGGRSLFQSIRDGIHYDILLLDIDMPDMDGIRLGLQLRERLSSTALIYVSNREDRVFDSFAAKPMRFIRKSHFSDEWEPALDEVLHSIERDKEKRTIRLSVNGQIARIDPDRVRYVESFRKFQTIHSEEHDIECQIGLRELEEMLKIYGFIRIHKSYLVNSHYIWTMGRTSLELDDGTVLPIGRAYQQRAHEEFENFLIQG